MLNLTMTPIEMISKPECQALLDKGQAQHTILLACSLCLILICVYLFYLNSKIERFKK